jgi:hypothetical protein
MENNDKLIDHPDLELRKPQKVTVVGFVIAWVLVFIIIGLTVLIASIGK